MWMDPATLHNSSSNCALQCKRRSLFFSSFQYPRLSSTNMTIDNVPNIKIANQIVLSNIFMSGFPYRDAADLLQINVLVFSSSGNLLNIMLCTNYKHPTKKWFEILKIFISQLACMFLKTYLHCMHYKFQICPWPPSLPTPH